MRFLADMGVSMSTVRMLRDRGHEAIHLREEKLNRLPDIDILKKAREENRIVITFDLDFGDLLAIGNHAIPSVIIFRLHNQTPASVQPKLVEIITNRGRDLLDGALVIVEDTRYRVRRLPIEPSQGKEN